MGRSSTGAICVNECRRIELSYLIKNNYFIKGAKVESTFRWSDGSSIGLETYYKHKDERDCIRLTYTRTDINSHKEDYDYRIYLTSIPSNLGKGEVLYFLCPITYKRCRILYGGAYGSPIYKSREAYANRLYYKCQWSSKYDYWLNRVFDLEQELNTLKKRLKRTTYKGKPTKLVLRIFKLENKLKFAERKKWEIFDRRMANWGKWLF